MSYGTVFSISGSRGGTPTATLRSGAVLSIPSGSTLNIGGTVDFSGSFSIDELILTDVGRISTGTSAGTSLALDASTATYAEGMELRWHIADWSDVVTWTSAKGMYLRMENQEANASGSIYGAEIYGVANNVNTQYVWGGLFYAYSKGATARTIDSMYAIQPELTFDAGSSTHTLTTEAICVRAKITGGKVDDYTKIHGVRVIAGDMNGSTQTYGNAYHVIDDSDMSGTISWTKGLYLEAACTTGIDISGATTTGVSIAGAATTGISMAANMTTGIDFASGTYGVGIDMTDVKINGTDDDLSLFRMGGYDTANTITTALTANTFGLTVNIDNQINSTGAQWLAGIYCKTQLTTATCSNVSSVALMIRGLIKQAATAYYGIQSHIKFEAGTAQDVSSEVIGVSAQIYGAASAGTGLYWGVKSDLRATNTPTATQTSACFFGVGTVSCGSGLYIEPLGGTTMSCGINLHAAGSMTNAIRVAGTTNVTNLFNCDAAAGFITSDTNTPGAAATHKIKCEVGGTAFYLAGYADF